MKYRQVEIGVAIGLALIVLAVWIKPQLPVDAATWVDRYDYQYKKYAKRYFGVDFDWRWFKAQGITESGLIPHALSSKGALGIMQILPTTFSEVFQEHVLLPGITEPRWNIAAGIAYDRRLYDRWSQHLSRAERFTFTLASYNAGFTRIKQAQNQAQSAGRRANEWKQVAGYVPDETRQYVEKILSLMGESG